ncbi:uncharacterized protein LOC135490806 [Lineus longissimus]|uniref:uncharacterized protein LOC135490806 n=1 Tax=Lineus longissimus TaxID=88925 RepID=UPI002B4DBCDC
MLVVFVVGLLASAGFCHAASPDCAAELGLEDGRIKSHQLSASSMSPGADIDDVRFDCCKGDYPGGFCLQKEDNPWFQVDFGTMTAVSGIKLQLTDSKESFVKSFHFQYLRHDKDEFLYFNNGNVQYKFEGSANSTVLTSKTRFTPIVTRKIRILPLEYRNRPCFRMELLGCDTKVLCPKDCQNGGTCVAKNSCACPQKFSGKYCEKAVTIDPIRCNYPLGLESGYIKDNQITASSNAPGSSPAYVRLNCCDNKGTRGWCPKPSVAGRGQYVEVRLGKSTAVTKVAMQHPAKVGDALPDKYLTIYAIKYPIEGKMDYYRYRGQPATLKAAANATLSMATRLPTPFIANKLQIYALAFEGSPCFRMELYGCDPKGCAPEGCQNGGWCEDYSCRCTQGFAGRRCEIGRGSVITHDVTFIAAKGDTIETKNGTFPTHGGAAILKPGKKGKSLSLRSSLWYVDLGDQDSHCYANPERCEYGLSISVYLRFLNFKDQTYIISNGGHMDDSYGVAFFYEKDQVHFRVSTYTKRYLVSYGDLKKGEWYLFELSWKKEGEITMTVNKKHKEVSTKSQTRKGNLHKNNLLIGASPSQVRGAAKRRRREIVETTIDVEGADFWDLDFGILEELEIVKEYPTMTTEPVIKAEVSNDGRDVLFRCMLPKVEERNVNFFVEWLSKGEVIHKEMVNDDNEFAELDEPDYMGHIDAKNGLTCRVSSCFATTCQDEKSPAKVSAEYKPEIKIVTAGPLEVHEGGAAAILELELTLPPRFYCDCDLSQKCDLKIIATIPPKKDLTCPSGKTMPQAVVGYPGTKVEEAFCGTMVSSTNWDETITIPIKAKVDNKYDKDQTRQIILEAVCVVDGNVKEVVTSTQITVNVKDKDCSGICKSLNDPHMTTFDGSYYNNYDTGEFILYKHRQLPYMITGYYRKCGGGYPSCNCGAAAKIGDDVILLDRCGPKPDPNRRHLTVTVFKNGELTPGTKILRLDGGAKYEVIFPHGTVLTVQNSYQQFVNIWVKPAVGDFGQTDGLCGTFNKKRDDDGRDKTGKIHRLTGQPHNFFKTWKVIGNESLYQGVCPKRENDIDSVNIYCECSTRLQNRCGFNYDTIACPGEQCPPKGKDITDEVADVGKIPSWCKTEKPDVDNEFEFNETWIPIEPEWPTVSGKTEKEAKEFCTKFIKTSVAGVKCKDLEIDIAKLVEGCIADIKLTDSKDWAKAALDSLKLECLNEIDKEIDKWVPGDGGILIPPTEITDVLCDNDCTGRGKCQKGVCICDQDYHGSDCSIKITTPPVVIGIVDGGLCPIGKICKGIVIIGEKFLEVDTLVCTVQKVEVTATGQKNIGDPVVVKGKYINGELVECPNPFDGISVVITVSNNGHIQSGKVLVICYDPQCQTCDWKKGTCIIRANKCLINGQCYSSGEIHPNDKLKMCIPNKSQIKWSVNPDCILTEMPSPDAPAEDNCGVMADVVFMIDFSPSVGRAKLAQAKRAINFVLDQLDLDESNIRIALGGFGEHVETGFNLNAFTDRKWLKKSVDNYQYIGPGGTNLLKLLQKLRTDFFLREHGSRREAPDVAIVFTDGTQTADQVQLLMETEKAHAAGIWVLVVNLGTDIMSPDLHAIASPPTKKYVFNIGDFKLLQTLAKLLVRRVCEVGRPLCKTRTWFEDKNKIIKGLDARLEQHVTSIMKCRDMCDSEDKFVCKSVEYDHGHELCRLSKYNVSMIYDTFFIKDKQFSYYDWECSADEKKDEPACVFPFKRQNKLHDHCLTEWSQGYNWCATTSDYDKDKKWKKCYEPCVFPFRHNKEWKNGCIRQGNEYLWCSVTSDYDRDKRWKKC